MATNTAYLLSDIQNFGYELFKNICQYTYLSNIPTSLTNNTTDFMVISTPTTVTDYNAYGKCSLQVEVFVRAKTNGIKDNQKMRNLQKAIFDKIDAFTRLSTNPYHIQYDTNMMFEDFDEKMGFHVSINFFDITIQPITITN